MDQLPALQTNITYLWNSAKQNYDVLDLNTGKIADHLLPATDEVGYSLLLADQLCEEIRNGKTLTTLLKEQNIKQARFYAWVSIYPEFKRRYELARKQRAESFADQAIELSLAVKDKDQVPAAKLAIETLKWAAEKADPERFAKPKESVDTGRSGVTIHLHTGVLEKAAPTDIVVDDYGNFQGFGNEVKRDQGERSIELDSRDGTFELSADRFRVYDTAEDGERAEATQSTSEIQAEEG